MEELIPIFLFLCIAGVLILRPVTKKLGLLLEAVARERTAQVPVARAQLDGIEVERVTLALERLTGRLDRMEDRMAFMERLVEDRPRRHLTG